MISNLGNSPSATDLAFANWLTEEEQARERAVVQARAFHDGEQMVYLTQRMTQVLGTDAKFNLNFVRTVVGAVAELLLISKFDSKNKALAEWALELWKANRMDEKQADVHEGTLRDGEYFVLVDWDFANARPRLTPVQRYTDPSVSLNTSSTSTVQVSPLTMGDGFGCRAFYQNDDENQPMLYAVKRWTEYIGDPTARPGNVTQPSARARNRLTRYYPDRIEKYAAQGSQWVPITDPEDVNPDNQESIWPLPWKDKAGKPLGIPAIHFRNPSLRCEAWDAIPPQKLLNKALIDLLISADTTAFRILFAAGFTATNDGKEPRWSSDGTLENALMIEPGSLVNTSAKATEAALTAIEPADLTALLSMVDKAITWTAMVTSTPLNRFQLTGQVISADSQKAGEGPLYAKARNRQTRYGNSWEDCLAMARRLESTFGSKTLDVNEHIESVWEPLEPRDTLAELTEKEKFWQIVSTTVAQTLGEIPVETVLRDLGWTDEQLKTFGTQKLAAIQLQQEDVIPNVSQ